MIAPVMQITMKNAIHVTIGVQGGQTEYKQRKDEILKCTKEFVTVIDNCTIRKDDISIIEYFEKEYEEEQVKKG